MFQGEFTKENLVQMCKELLEKRDTGVLCNGLVREEIRKIQQEFNANFNDAKYVVESEIKDLAMEQVVKKMTIDKSALCYSCKKLQSEYSSITGHYNVCVADSVEPERFKLLRDPARNEGVGCSEYVERDKS